MSKPFKFQGEKAAAGHAGAKEKVAAKRNQRLWAMKRPLHQRKRSSLLSGSHRDFCHFGELGERRKTSSQWFHRAGPERPMQEGASADDKAAPSKPLLVLLWQRGCTGDCCDLPWDSARTVDGGEGGWLRSAHGRVCQKPARQPRGFCFPVFDVLLQCCQYLS